MSELKLNRRQALTGAAVAGAAVLTGAVPAAAAATRCPTASSCGPGWSATRSTPARCRPGRCQWPGRSPRTSASAGWSGPASRSPARSSPTRCTSTCAAWPRVGTTSTGSGPRGSSARSGVPGPRRPCSPTRRCSGWPWSAARTSRTATGRRSTAWPRKTSTSSSTSVTTSTRATRRASSPTAATSRRRRSAWGSYARWTTTATGTPSTRATRRCAPPMRPSRGSPPLRIYRRFDFGRLARFNVLDTRQYRTDQPGGFSNDLGPEGPGRANVAGTLTGSAQEQWLADGLTSSPARWNVIAQQVMMSRTRFPNPTGGLPPTIVNLDQWDGYQPQRERLLRLLAERRVANPVVLAGDIHSTWFSELKVNFDDPASPPVAVEFVGTSISSDFPVLFDGPIKAANPFLNPHVRFFDGLKRGYLRCEVGRGLWRTDVRVVDTIAVRATPVRTDVSFIVESGRPVLVRL